MRSIAPPSTLAPGTTVHRACGRTIIPTTTAPSCSIPTVTTSKPCATRQRERARDSVVWANSLVAALMVGNGASANFAHHAPRNLRAVAHPTAQSSHRLELLRPAAPADLGRVQIPLRVDGDVVQPFELSRLAPVPAPLRQRLAVLARDGVDLAVGTVGDEDEALLRIDRQDEVPNRAVLQRRRLDPELLHEGPVLAEHLDAVVDAVAHVDQPVIGDAHAMHRVAEALRQRRVGAVGRQLVVGTRLLAVGAQWRL